MLRGLGVAAVGECPQCGVEVALFCVGLALAAGIDELWALLCGRVALLAMKLVLVIGFAGGRPLFVVGEALFEAEVAVAASLDDRQMLVWAWACLSPLALAMGGCGRWRGAGPCCSRRRRRQLVALVGG